MDEETALATIFANTRRHRRNVDLVTLAKCFEFLRKIYRTQRAVAEKTDLSREMVREFLQILTLPDFVQELIRSRKIDSVDTAYRLSKIRDENTLRDIVDKLIGIQAHDFRDIYSSMQEHAGLPFDVAKEIVMENKPRNLHLFIIDFSEGDYKKLLSKAKEKGSSPAEIIKQVVEKWLSETDGADSTK